MYILFEEHQYQLTSDNEGNRSDAAVALEGIFDLQNVEKKVSVGYVGYCFNSKLKDCIFILPKVLLSDKDEYIIDDEKKVDPALIVSPKGQEENLSEEYRKFLYEFAVWIYRVLCVFYKNNPKSDNLLFKELPQVERGKRHKANTFLDIILSLIQFNKYHQNFFLFILKNQHSGNNKINWSQTIAQNEAIIQDDNIVYYNPVNKKRRINFDEELLVIYFSILNYVCEQYGFNVPINYNYDLITGNKFTAYREKGIGKRRLMQIKYKYFSDTALELWNLCYAYFVSEHQVYIDTNQKDYILAKKFDIVFEAMIDELLGDPRSEIPNGLKDQEDGKRVDHMYRDYAMTSYPGEVRDEVYYIGDSKYYKLDSKLDKKSVYKQYTYARNVIQWNINLFLNDDLSFDEEERKDLQKDRNKYRNIRLRKDDDIDITEGYDIIPNFFLSAFVNENREYDANENNIRHHLKGGEQSTYITYQFLNRLFDRDTLMLSHYDVNFLYVVYLYARNKPSEKAQWKEKVRNLFRNEIRMFLKNKFDFYVITPHPRVYAENFIQTNFQQIIGKIFKPFKDLDNRAYFSLALQKPIENPKNEIERKRNELLSRENDNIKSLLQESFYIKDCPLGDNPYEKFADCDLQDSVDEHSLPSSNSYLTKHYIENYLQDSFLIGLYQGEPHLKWILSREPKYKRDDIYNVRIDKSRPGHVNPRKPFIRSPKFVIIYDEHNPSHYFVFRVKHSAIIKQERMKTANYFHQPTGDYLCYILDEEVTLGTLDIIAILQDAETGKFGDQKKPKPIYITGEQLLEYRT